jgi:formate/nitrite transporter FocA (FNT family)
MVAWADGCVSTAALLRNWVVVYLGNAVGGIGIALLVILSHHIALNDGKIEVAALGIAKTKIELTLVTAFFRGILCNLLV